MGAYVDRWTAAKVDFDKGKALFPAPMLEKLKGAKLVPAMKAFDKADGFEARQKAMMPFRAAKIAYDKDLRAAIAEVKAKNANGPAIKALQRLEQNLLEILEDADKSAQPPRPGGGTVAYEVLRNFNLANGFKPKHLDLQATKVDVVVEVDKVLDELIKNGQESLKINHLGDIAKAEIETVGDAFSKTMQALDAKMDGLDAKGRTDKLKEGNEVLKHYAKIVQDRVNTAVEKEWQAYLSRRKHLKDFRIKCTVKLALGLVGVGIAAASVVLSFGAMWQNVFAIAKGILSIADTLKTWSEDIDKVYATLMTDVVEIDKLNRQREAAKAAGASQKASKTAQGGKELLVALLPITKNMVRSASSVQDRSKQMLGLVSKIESQADKLVGELNKAIHLMSKLPEKQMNAAMKADAEKMNQAFQKLFGEITGLHKRSQNAAKFAERALNISTKLVKEDSWAGVAGDATNLGSRAFTVYSLANFACQCAKHGTTIIQLL
jgi:hypothetical protein